MGTDDKGERTVKTTETVFGILESVQERDGARISELSRDLGLAKSTVHRHLATLERKEYVVKEADAYHIGLRFLDLGEYAKNRKEAYRMAEPKVEELADETKERVQFIVEEHGHAVYVHRKIGEHAVQTDPGIGKRISLHSTAAGKSILAHMPETSVERIVERRDLPPQTENTITDPDALFDELATIRDRGYSFNKQENIEGLRAVGVPVKQPTGKVIGALSVSGPTHRMRGERFETELPELLLGTANELELNIAYA